MGLGRVSSEPFSSDETLLVSTFYSNHTVGTGLYGKHVSFHDCLTYGDLLATRFHTLKQFHILSHGYLSARLNSLPCPLLISFHRSHRSRRKNSSSSPVPVVGSRYSHCFCPVPCPGRLDQLLSRLRHPPCLLFYPPCCSDANAGAQARAQAQAQAQGHRTAISHVGSCVPPAPALRRVP